MVIREKNNTDGNLFFEPTIIFKYYLISICSFRFLKKCLRHIICCFLMLYFYCLFGLCMRYFKNVYLFAFVAPTTPAPVTKKTNVYDLLHDCPDVIHCMINCKTSYDLQTIPGHKCPLCKCNAAGTYILKHLQRIPFS